MNSGDVINPFIADAAATAGLDKYTSLSICPILPVKFLFVVEMALSPAASIPICPPKHGPHVGGETIAPELRNFSINPSLNA